MLPMPLGCHCMSIFFSVNKLSCCLNSGMPRSTAHFKVQRCSWSGSLSDLRKGASRNLQGIYVSKNSQRAYAVQWNHGTALLSVKWPEKTAKIESGSEVIWVIKKRTLPVLIMHLKIGRPNVSRGMKNYTDYTQLYN